MVVRTLINDDHRRVRRVRRENNYEKRCVRCDLCGKTVG
jgi:hypothetical protein